MDHDKDLFDENTGPSIDSPIVEERIAARRLRIAKRLEALQKNTSDEKKEVISNTQQEVSKSQAQIEQSYQRLTKLCLDGSELVSNVAVACDAREVLLRKTEDDSRIKRHEKLEWEINMALDKFEEITKRWEDGVKKEVPQELQKVLLSQKAKCNEVIDDKNRLINELQQDLKQKDDQYVKDLRKQAEDIDLMIERMEEQMKTLKQAYEQELNNIEESLYLERKELLERQKAKWTQQNELRRNREIEYADLRQKRVENFENQLQTLRVQDAEEYNMVRIKLETDVQILEQNLQQMKATYQLNQEKLEYNFQVLKKRDEENTITKSQQKRKITRLQDMLNNLKQKLKNQEHSFMDENHVLSEDLKRITEQYKEVQKKFRHFQSSDEKKFNDIWRMNETEIKNLVSDLLCEDRIIFEQQLGLEWNPPKLDFLKNVGPLQNGKQYSKSAMQTAQDVFAATSHDTVDVIQATSLDANVEGESSIKIDGSHDVITSNYKLSASTLKSMLELLCDESGFLVESKLTKLLAPIDKDERSLMKLDAIFNAIGVDTEEDIITLSKYLCKMRTVPIEAPPGHASSCASGRSSSHDEDDEEESDENAPKHRIEVDLIHPNDVVKALRQFVEDNQDPVSEAVRTRSKLGVGLTRDNSKDGVYWKMLSSVVDKKKEHVWDALIEGFEKYAHVLKERANLIQETDSLRQQNSELRMLLHQYLSSKVNNELQIPPTRLLQLELPRQ